MRLLCMNGHSSDLNEQMDSDFGFGCYRLDKDDIYRVDNNKSSCTLFMIEGEVNCDLGESQGLRIVQGRMMFIPQNMRIRIRATTCSECILLFWNKNMSICDKLFLRSLSILDATTDTDDMIIPIKRPLLEVLGSVRTYQETGLLCRHMHLLKQQELFVVLRGFYTKKELTAFFAASAEARQRFERFVLENYRKVNSVKEFAGLYYVSERTFSRKFHSCFEESPYKWIQKKKAEQIREIIRDSEFSLKIIAKQFGFSSLAYFTTYCKRVLGVSPSQLRRKNNRTDK